MEGVLGFLRGALLTSGSLYAEAAPFLLVGLLISGFLAGVLRRARVVRLLGGPGLAPIARAALLGIPLPLCSCGVIPAAISLRRHGASRGATVSFVVSTPETGVDSIAISYALLGPLIAIARPVAAFVTALVAGVAVGSEEEPAATAASSGGDSEASASPAAAGWTRRGIAHAVDEILGEIGPWLLGGVLLAGVLAEALPDDLFTRVPGGEIGSMLVMLAIGVPLYICASASTPVAASLMEKGLSPGAALVFLLVGPATNIATILILARELGRRPVAIYLGVIAGASLLFGFALNALWSRFGGGGGLLAPAFEIPPAVSFACGALLLALIAAQAVRSAWRRHADATNGACAPH